MRQRDTSPAKTTRPRSDGVLPRRRLFRLLDRSRPLVWISTLPGAGKTTLAASYLVARRAGSLWYQLDEGDTDPATFFYYLERAARRAAPSVRRPLPLMKPAYRLALAAFARRFFEEVYRRLRPPFVLVLDDYHRLPPRCPLHDVLRDAVEALPRGGKLMVLSRGEPPASLARARAAGAMTVLGWDDLRLSLEESRALARLRSRRPSPDSVRRLHATTGGWAAGLTLMLEESPGASVASRADARAPSVVFDYFAAEIFGRADRATQAFLVQTALLPWMTVRMAAEVTGLARAGRVLADLHASNYFTEKRDGAEPVYQYHALFREFLLARGRSALTPARRARVLRRAAALLDEAGQVHDAVGLLREAEDWRGLGELVIRHAPELIAHGRNQTLETWLRQLPARRLDDDGWLQYWLGVAQMPFGPADARRVLEHAFERFRRAGEAAGAFSAWSGVVDSIVWEWGDFAALDPWIAELEELMRTHPTFPSAEIEARVTTSMFAALAYRQPGHPAIEVWAERAFAVAHHADVDRRMLTGSVLSNYHLWMGEPGKAALALDLVRDLARGRDASPYAVITYHSVDATYHWHLAEPEPCLRAAAAGQAAARASGIQLLDVNLLALSAYGALVAGDLAGLRERVQQLAAEAAAGRTLHLAHYHFLAAWEALIRRNLTVALEHAQEALRRSIAAGTPFPQTWNHIGLAHIFHARGEVDPALHHLATARDIAQPLRSRMLDYMLGLADAHFALEGGRDAAGLAALRGAMALGRRQGFVMARWWQPAVMSALCARALEVGIEVEYVRRLVRMHRLVPDVPPLGPDAWPWAITIRALGAFEVERDGAALAFARKVARRPLELLKALIALGGRDIGEAQVADALWPEAAGDAAHQALATTLHRLRTLLGGHEIIRLQEGRLGLDPGKVWVDIWAFEELLERAERAHAGSREADAVDLTERALGLYRGPFLGARDTGSWALSTRERLRAKFLRATGQLAGQWMRAGKLDRALECYERGLAIDDLAEEFYRGLMACLQRLDRRAEALEAYARCQRVLAATLKVPPSAATEALHRSLRAS